MISTRYRAVLFDLDGTLVDSYDALTAAINHARRASQLPDLKRAEVQQFVGEGAERLLQRVFAPGPVPESAREIFESRYDQICCEGSACLEDVEPTLAAIASEDIRMAICTNKPTVFSRKILEHLSIAGYFDAIVGPDMADARKPDPQHVLFTLAATGVSRAEAIFVGDMPIDVAAARAAGIDVAVIATGSSTSVALRAAEPDYYLERFAELLDVLKYGALTAR